MHLSGIWKSDSGSTSVITIKQSHMTTVCPRESHMMSYINAKIRGLKELQSITLPNISFYLVALNTYRNAQFNQGSGLTINIKVKVKGIITD